MADSDADNDMPELPPKLSLPKAGKPAGKKEEEPEAEDKGSAKKRPSIKIGEGKKTGKQARPQIKLKADEVSDDMATTMHIDLSDALSGDKAPKAKEPAQEESATTMHIDLSSVQDGDAKAESKAEDSATTMHIDLSDAVEELNEQEESSESASSATMHIDLSSLQEEASEARKAQKGNVGDKSSTMHLDLEDLEDEQGDEEKADKPDPSPKTIPLTKRRTRPKPPETITLSKKSSDEDDKLDEQNTTMRIDLMSDDEASEDKDKTVKRRPVKQQDPSPRTIKVQPRTKQPKNEEESGARTAHIDLTKADSGEDEAPQAGPRTIKIKPKTTKKSETSRINLEEALATTDAADGKAPVGKQTDGPKTIRLKPGAGGKTVKRKPKVESSKSETSRISLEDALASDSEHQGSAAVGKPTQSPKTIRLKRPSEGATIKTEGRKADDEDDGDPEDITATRRKTIRLKRPDRPSSGGLKVARGESDEDEDGDEESGLVLEDEAVEIDQPGATFAIFAMIAVIAIGVAAWMFATQVFPEYQNNLQWFQQHERPGPF